jgi:5'-nucleotidase
LSAGDLTYGAVYEVIPFDNAIATLQVTGDELTALLRAAYGSRKGVFQVSGLEVKLSQCPGNDRLKAVALEGGKALEPKARYRVVLPDFLARGGDGLGPTLARIEPRYVDLGSDRDLNIRDALVDYLQKKKQPLIAPRSGRIVFVHEEGPCPPNEKAGYSR